MNGIEKITDRIAVDTETEIKALKSRAEAQAKEIFAGYQAAADADYADAMARGQKDAKERVERLSSVSDLEARKLKLKAKQEMLDKAFALASEKLLSLPAEAYISLLTKLAVNACVTGQETLVFSETDRALYGAKVVNAANDQLSQAGKTAELKLSVESRPFRGGLYVQDGKVETNCTFDTLVRLQRETMSLEVADILFN